MPKEVYTNDSFLNSILNTFFFSDYQISANFKKEVSLLGVALGYLTIFFGAVQLAPMLGAAGVPIFLGLFAALMVILGKFDIFALTPAAFFGFATYFGTGANLKAALIGLLLGPVVGYISVKATTIFSPKAN